MTPCEEKKLFKNNESISYSNPFPVDFVLVL
jgi:hypothetical protein